MLLVDGGCTLAEAFLERMRWMKLDDGVEGGDGKKRELILVGKGSLFVFFQGVFTFFVVSSCEFYAMDLLINKNTTQQC